MLRSTSSQPSQPTKVSFLPYHILALISIPVLSVLLSLWQGAYNFDPHHWGLMLSNAKDLAQGKQPYSEIFIQYGILTTLIHTASYVALGNNLRVLIGVTSCFYAVGVVGIYFVSLRLISDRKVSLYCVCTAFLLHPIVIYPWSNYLAFPFLVFGLWFLLTPNVRWQSALSAGLMFGLSILTREGLSPALFIFSAVVSVLFLRVGPSTYKFRLFVTTSYWVGFILFPGIFFIYLWLNNLLVDWYRLSVILPQVYMEELMPSGVFPAAFKMATFFVEGIIVRKFRVTLFALIIISAGFYVLSFAVNTRARNSQILHFVLGAFVLLMTSAALHLNEIFRLACGVSVGVVLGYSILKKYKLEDYFFFITSALLIMTVSLRREGNYFFPTRSQLVSSVEISEPTEFYGQRWPVAARDFYVQFQKDVNRIYRGNCGIKYFRNNSRDAFLAVLAPFQQYQLAPFGTKLLEKDEYIKRLKPDIDPEKKIRHDKDVILLVVETRGRVESSLPSDDWIVVRRYAKPKSLDTEEEKLLLIAPKGCSSLFDTKSGKKL